MSADQIAGGVDVSCGGIVSRPEQERPSRDEYDTPRIDYRRLGSSACRSCGAELEGPSGECSWPRGIRPRCSVMLRRHADGFVTDEEFEAWLTEIGWTR